MHYTEKYNLDDNHDMAIHSAVDGGKGGIITEKTAKILTVEAKTVKTKIMMPFRKKRLKSAISWRYFERL